MSLLIKLGLSGKESACNVGDLQEMWVQSLGREDPLEEEMATHSNILAWEIPCTEEPGGLQSMGLQRVGHKWATNQQQQQQWKKPPGLFSFPEGPSKSTFLAQFFFWNQVRHILSYIVSVSSSCFCPVKVIIVMMTLIIVMPIFTVHSSCIISL